MCPPLESRCLLCLHALRSAHGLRHRRAICIFRLAPNRFATMENIFSSAVEDFAASVVLCASVFFCLRNRNEKNGRGIACPGEHRRFMKADVMEA
jgi:hypothetical protein